MTGVLFSWRPRRENTMNAKISQPLLDEVAGLFGRREVVAGLTRVRHKLEQKEGYQTVIKLELTDLLFKVCQELGLTPYEIIEVLGATWAVEELWRQLIPDSTSFDEECRWIESHRDKDLGTVILGGAE
jgi:hypothetical protein